jgi:hypothetical protein
VNILDIILTIIAVLAVVTLAAVLAHFLVPAWYKKTVAPVAPTVDPLLLKIHDLLSGLDKSVAVNHATVTAKIDAVTVPPVAPGSGPIPVDQAAKIIAQAVVAALPQTTTASPIADQPPVADVPESGPLSVPVGVPPVVLVAVKSVPMAELTSGQGTVLCRAELAGGIYLVVVGRFTFDRAALAYPRNADGSFVSAEVEGGLTAGLDPNKLEFGRVTCADAATGKYDDGGQSTCVPTLEKLEQMIRTPPPGWSIQSLESLRYSARPAADVAVARAALVAALAGA